jgi:hydantoinase/carbamoylase family amidase
MTLLVPPQVIAAHYEVLHHIGNLGPRLEDGFLRAGYSDEETQAMKHFESKGRELGLLSRWDGAGNLFLEYPGRSPEFVETASHLDTVPNGGNFDGAAGVTAGFAAIQALLSSGAALRRGVRLRIWRNEESATFNSLYTGSLGAFGQYNCKSLANRFGGRTLEEAMRSQGVNPSHFSGGKPTLSKDEIDRIGAHIELHIEQGNLLETTRKQIGVVTSIRGSWRAWFFLTGSFDHSGATPMGAHFRRDVNLAMAKMHVGLDMLAHAELAKERDLVQTVGVINSSSEFNANYPELHQNALTKVSGFGYFSLDIRSADNAFHRSYCTKAEAFLSRIAEEHGITLRMQPISVVPAVEALDSGIQSALEHSCRELGCSHQRMPSGAGHDAAVVARQKKSDGSSIPVGMIFIPCRGGKSHCVEEFASCEDIARGASVLAHTMLALGG